MGVVSPQEMTRVSTSEEGFAAGEVVFFAMTRSVASQSAFDKPSVADKNERTGPPASLRGLAVCDVLPAHDADAGHIAPLADTFVAETVDGPILPCGARAGCGQGRRVQIVRDGINREEHEAAAAIHFDCALERVLKVLFGRSVYRL